MMMHIASIFDSDTECTLCLSEQDFLKYYTKAGMDTEDLEV